LSQGLFVGDAATQDAPTKYTKLDLRHVQLTPVFRGIVKLQALGDSPGFCGREGLAKRSRPVGVEVVQSTLIFSASG
jgi:hypothetical protein